MGRGAAAGSLVLGTGAGGSVAIIQFAVGEMITQQPVAGSNTATARPRLLVVHGALAKSVALGAVAEIRCNAL